MGIANANLTSGVGYHWGAGDSQRSWMYAIESGDMYEQSAYVQVFGNWMQGGDMYIGLTNNPTITVTWTKTTMRKPTLIKVEYNNIPTIDTNIGGMKQALCNVMQYGTTIPPNVQESLLGTIHNFV